MKDSIRKASEKGMPIYAECGGFMYLAKKIHLLDGVNYDFCGIFDLEIKMRKNLNIKRFGYINIETGNEIKLKGHEFHYSKLKAVLEDTRKFKAVKKDGRSWDCIFNEKKLYAGYPHLHFFGSYKFIEEVF